MNKNKGPDQRKRLTREERFSQLLENARLIIKGEGTDALTLGRLAEVSAVSRPVVYDHFVTRHGLLRALYEDYDARQTAVLNAALSGAEGTLSARARVIAEAYVDCVFIQGGDIPGVAAALAGSPEMDALKRHYQSVYIARCRQELEPFNNGDPIPLSAFLAMTGAADSLSEAAVRGDISREEATQELIRVITQTVHSGA